MKKLSKYFSVLRINWIHSLEYRANALIGLFAILSGLFIEYQIWSLIYSKSNNLDQISLNPNSEASTTFMQLMVFIFLSIIVGQLKSSWVTSSQMILEIRQGHINKYLVRPLSYFWYYFMMFLGVNSLFFIVYSLLIVCFTFIFPTFIFPTIFSLFGFIISLIISIYLSYCIYFIMVCCAFWFGEVRAIVVAYNLGMLTISGQYIPIRLFPESILEVIHWTPIPFLVDFPVSIAIGITSFDEAIGKMFIAISWCIILTILSSIIYKKGIIKYEAFGQ